MYNYHFRQNSVPTSNIMENLSPIVPSSKKQNQPPLTPATPTSNQGQATPATPTTNQTQTTPATAATNQTQTTPYSQLQATINEITELYHTETANLDLYKRLLASAPNSEDAETIESLIENTTNNIMYLRQIYLGLTGNALDGMPMQSRVAKNMSYKQMLKSSFFSKIDTLGQYSMIHRTMPIRPYKDLLSDVIIVQLKDAATCNYLICTCRER